jgi:Replication factor RFC1 C terminal domain
MNSFIVTDVCVLQSAVKDVIECMDKYYLSQENWDTVVELGVNQNKDDLVLKKISAATKTTLMKKCIIPDVRHTLMLLIQI